MVGNNPIASGSGPSPDFDEQTADGLSIISAINEYRIESEDARRTRRWKNDRNWDAFLGKQDWRHKQEGQSTEFLPKVPVSVEQLAALVKRGMIQFGDWFSIEVDNTLQEVVDGAQIRTILKCFLDDLWGPNNTKNQLTTVVSDAVKQALLKSLFIIKTHGSLRTKRTFNFERGEGTLATEEAEEWQLRVDLVRFEDYYPDPTGAGLYEIHRVERDLHEILDQSGEGKMYDETAVKQLINQSFTRPEDEELSDRDRNQDESTEPGFRKRVVLDEFWGTILNRDGTVAHRNVVATVANGRYLIRPPEPNPFWHQESPFDVMPLIRVPHSVFHKALFDHASDLNLAINELFNLMLDGGMAAVWGIKQLRLEDLEDPGQVAGGVRQGTTLVVKQTLPHNAKVLETVAEGDVPRDALAVYQALDREYNTAAMVNELKLGALPPKQVLATEILESSQSQNLMLDGIIADLEVLMSSVLRKSWLNILQNADDIPEGTFKTVADRKVGLLLMRASPEERFALFAGKCAFKVFGISGTLTRALDFQKIMALLQATTVNPMLFQAFMLRFSPNRTLDRLLTTLNINPETIQKTPEELQNAQQEMERVAGAAQLISQGPRNAEGGPGGVASGPGSGGDETTAAIQQGANPQSGLVPNS